MTDSAKTIAWFGFSLTHHRTNAVFPSTPTNGLGTEEIRRKYGEGTGCKNGERTKSQATY